MASSASPEHCLVFRSSLLSNFYTVIGSEVKAVNDSVRRCFPQLIAVCASSSIEMYRIGLNREDCVVPGIVMAGASVQFLAVYLLWKTFPVLMTLSPELSPFGTLQEQLAIATWCLRLTHFANTTADLLLYNRTDLPPFDGYEQIFRKARAGRMEAAATGRTICGRPNYATDFTQKPSS